MSQILSSVNLLSATKGHVAQNTQSNVTKEEAFSSVYEGKVKDVDQSSTNKKSKVDNDSPTDVKEVANKEKTSTKVSPQEEDKLAQVESEMETLLEEVEKIAKELNVDMMSILQMLFNFQATGENQIMIDFIMEATGAESKMDMLTTPNVMEMMNGLKQLATELNNMLLDMGIDPNQLALENLNLKAFNLDNFKSDDFDMKAFLNHLLANQETNGEGQQITPVEDIEIDIQLSSEGNKDVQEQPTSSTSKEQAGNKDENLENNLFLNKFNTIEMMKDKMVTVKESKTLDHLLKQEIVQQVVNRISLSSLSNGTSMTIQLKPEHLGNLLLTVATQKGSVTAHFVAENASVKEAIEMNLFQLKTTLEQQGINVDEIEVSVANNEYFEQRGREQSNSEQNKSNRRRVNKMNNSNISTEEELQEESQSSSDLVSGERLIDYSA